MPGVDITGHKSQHSEALPLHQRENEERNKRGSGGDKKEKL